MNTFEEQRKKFLNFLDAYSFPENPKSLYDSCRHILSIGGKRIRPVLCLMANDVFNEEHCADALQAALAVELFHNFSLVHDDIMDKADIRRGQPTVHNKYSEPTAILAGDVLNVYTYELLNNLKSDKRQAVISIFNKTAIEVCEGQQMDMDFEKREVVPIDEYLKMITLKTSVLLAASLDIGALLGGADTADAEHLYEFGKNVGLAFQLKDDYLDAYGDSEKTGKKVGGDIMANKKTIFYCYCWQEASPSQQQFLKELQAITNEERVIKTLQFYEEMGARDYVYQLKDDYSAKAFASLEKMTVPTEKLSELKKLASYLLQREY